ncbi:protein MMS22-like, partial [Lytechinus variegatus]|uniref:protein MMS22-like n=1 Tax=Lytechinus variegatus TaxID=7654 RepID=UPI001BB0DC5F
SWSPDNNGFLASRTLSRLLEGSLVVVDQHEGLTTQLFGCCYVTSTALLDQISHLFSILRQVLGKIESLLGKQSHWSVTDPLIEASNKLREQVLHFFFYVHSFIQRYLATSRLVSSQDLNVVPSLYSQQVEGFPLRLATELDNVSMFIGRLNELSSSRQYFTSRDRQASHDHLLLHCHLDVRWYIIQVLHHLHVSTTGSSHEIEIVECFNKQVDRLMQDLLTTATIRYNQLSLNEVHQTSLFPCNCLKEMWILLIHLLDHRHMNNSATSFWGIIHQLLSPILENVDGQSNRGATAKDPEGLCFWILQQLSSLYQYDKTGQEIGQPIARSHWYLVEDVLKKVLSKDAGTAEASLQSYLKHFLVLCHLWEPHSKILITLWDHFYRKLNHRLTAPGQGIQGLATISKSALAWFQTCKKRCDDHNTSGGQETSFHLFLRILACKMKKWNVANNTQAWKQFQGRLYSKFHSRTMQELGDTGLQHFFDLFLTLALMVDLSSLTMRVLDFVDLVPVSNVNISRRLLIWRGLLALCLIHEERQFDLELVADKLMISFNTVVRAYNQIKSDPLRKSDYWSLIVCYLEGVQEVIDSSNLLNLSEDKFIASGLGELLSSSGDQEIRSVLMFVQTTMARHRSLYKQLTNQAANDKTSGPLMTKYKVMSDALWSHIYPFVKQHSTTLTPPSQLADVAAGFTLLAADIPSGCGPETPVWSLFQYFGLQTNKVNPSIRTRYLCHLLPNQAFLETLDPPAGAGSLDCLLVRAWIHASIQLPGASDQMQELGRLVMKLPQVVSISKSMGVDESMMDASQPPVFRFFYILGKYSSSAQTYQEKLKRRSTALQYLGDLVALVRSQVRGQRSIEEMNRMYVVVGHAVKYCGNVLYSQGSSQSQLPGLLTELILFPGVFNLKKPLPANQHTAIRETLHLFVEGIGLHDVSRDSYIQRKLKEIMCHYFIRYKVKLSSSGFGEGLHPLLRALSNTFRGHVDSKDSTLRRYMLSEFKDRFLSGNPQQVGPHTSQAIAFIQELLQRTTSMAQITRDTVVLLGAVLDFMLLCESTSVKGQMSQILTQMMNACKVDTPPELEVELVSVVRSFLSRHIHHHRKASLGRLESLAVLHPKLMIRLIPDATRLIEECEHRRAVGVDTVLRQAYHKVLSHLGPEGQKESQRLQSQSKIAESLDVI